jgi:bifunctional DNase/RNase
MTPRPLTHDLVKNILGGLKIKLTKVIITEILDNTYYALLHLADGKREVPVDSRPSDAVAVALRLNAPIFVEEGILEKKSTDELEEWLKNLKPEDFGNVM